MQRDRDTVPGETDVRLGRNAVAPAPEERLERVVGTRIAPSAAVHLAPEQFRPLRRNRRGGAVRNERGRQNGRCKSHVRAPT